MREILDKGFGSMNMSIARNAADHIVSLSQGLPHYTHLLGLGSGRAMIGDERKMVERQDVTAAIGVALEGVQESTLTAYHNAILSTRKTLYPHVLVACALAGVDGERLLRSRGCRRSVERNNGEALRNPGLFQASPRPIPIGARPDPSKNRNA